MLTRMDPDEMLDADLAAEEFHGKPFPLTPEQGLAEMERRIRLLTARKAALLEAAGAAASAEPFLDAVRETNHHLETAAARLREYQIQRDGRN
jgi:hypothetical protein